MAERYHESPASVNAQSLNVSGPPGSDRLTFLCGALTGVFMGVIARCVHLAYHYMVEWKFELMYEALGEDKRESSSQVINTFAVCVGVSAVFAMGAAGFGLWEKTAQASGLPAIIALLNGISLPAVVSPKSLVATVAGLCFSIASGLVVGPEGPMIHVGAAAGRQLMRLFPAEFSRSAVVARTMVAVGAGAGVAAAFKAPFAGVMFVVEELASSMMSLQMVTCALVANTCAFFVAFWLEKAQAEGPVKYEFQADYGASFGCGYAIVDMLAVLPLAVACGCWGALFNAVNIRLNRLRGRWKNKWRGGGALLELLVVVLLTSAIVVVVPLGFSCKSTQVQHLLLDDELARINAGTQLQCVEREVYEQFLNHIQHYPLDHNSSSEETTETAVWVFKPSAHDVYLDLELFRHYGCHERTEEGELTHFNPMASLFLQPITEAISFLFERGMPKLVTGRWRRQ